MLKKIISGGQTGADQAGLYVAKKFGISTGGWAPRNWQTTDGPNKELLKSYGLLEHSGGYKIRTLANVRDSDGTIRMAKNFKSPGEICTLKAIENMNKPYFDIDLLKPDDPQDVVNWILHKNIEVLNVAGNHQYKNFDTFSLCVYYLTVVLEKLLYEDKYRINKV